MNTIPQVKFFITEIGKSLSGNPIAVGWDYCKCGSHIVNCTCVGGPTEPKYITKMREKELARATTTDVVSAPEPPAVPLATATTAVVEQVDESSGVGPFCTGCHKTVDESNSDRQDDGTYLCYACQEAS